jgi:hypothetical protein
MITCKIGLPGQNMIFYDPVHQFPAQRPTASPGSLGCERTGGFFDGEAPAFLPDFPAYRFEDLPIPERLYHQAERLHYVLGQLQYGFFPTARIFRLVKKANRRADRRFQVYMDSVSTVEGVIYE